MGAFPGVWRYRAARVVGLQSDCNDHERAGDVYVSEYACDPGDARAAECSRSDAYCGDNDARTQLIFEHAERQPDQRFDQSE
jgi:hypothetical protein